MVTDFASRVAAAAEEMRAKGVLHTETRVESLPQDVQELLLEMADRIRKLEQKAFSLEQDVQAMGRVSLNDLIRKAG